MASEPTDLIRAVDAALAQEAANEGGPIVDDPATLVRRLRDALAAAQNDIQVIADYAGADDEVTDILRCVRELAADRRALAEANATIERIVQQADDLERTNQHDPELGRFGAPINSAREVRRNVVDAFRRALKGES
ncbi:hypothetical protein ACLQ3K_25775 [Tsukamurella sp. DT100]|uniref:hypothetical protein n=1 Tax=Tsukamurella sp. DT100 TaxID=3393415 RepID=UPI003CF72460